MQKQNGVITSGSLFHCTTYSQQQWAKSKSGERECGNLWHTATNSSGKTVVESITFQGLKMFHEVQSTDTLTLTCTVLYVWPAVLSVSSWLFSFSSFPSSPVVCSSLSSDSLSSLFCRISFSRSGAKLCLNTHLETLSVMPPWKKNEKRNRLKYIFYLIFCVFSSVWSTLDQIYCV